MALTETECPRLISKAAVPGMASAIIQDGRLDGYVCCGTRSTRP
jgi:hypothetical protein